MRSFLFCLLLAISVAHLRAEEDEDVALMEIMEDEEEDARRPHLPAFAKCRDEFKKCFGGSTSLAEKKKCFEALRKCIADNRPTLPPFLVQCHNERVACLKKAGDDRSKRFACYRAYFVCLRNNRPSRPPRPTKDEADEMEMFDEEDARRHHPSGRPHHSHRPRPSRRPHHSHRPRPSRRPHPSRPAFVVQCHNERVECLKKAGDDRRKRFACYRAYFVCLRNNRPSRPPRPTKDEADEMEMFDEEDARRYHPSGRPHHSHRPRPSRRPHHSHRPRPSRRPHPSRPAFVEKCREEARKCIKAADGDREKRRECRKAFFQCLKDNRPSRPPRPTRS